MDRVEYQKAVERLNKWSIAYYTNDQPLATDEEYDKLYKEVVNYENTNNFKLDYSPTQRIGDKILTTFQQAKHIDSMWSMDNVFNHNELDKWISKFITYRKTYCCTPKLDGVSINLRYENGILVQAITRGNGSVGEDVTNNAKVISTIPLKISHLNKIEIRGEVVITKEDFDRLNKIRLKNNESLFANPRNTAAGSIRQFDSSITKSRNLKFIPWDIGYNELDFVSYSDKLEFLKEQGFLPIEYLLLIDSINSIEKYYNLLIKQRSNIPIMIDGMVIHLNNLKLCNTLGYTNKFPRFMVAYKFPPLEKITRLKDVTYQVGRTGTITPVGVLEPIDLCGSIISNVSLYNFDEIDRLGLMKNDYVGIIKSGDVIPKITSVYKDRRDNTVKEINIPTICPICNNPTVVSNKSIKCINKECKSRVVNTILFAVSRKCLDIKGIGISLIETLYDNKLVYNILDLYMLNKDKLLNLNIYSGNTIDKLLENINKSKGIPLYRFILSLGIDNVGENVAKLISNQLGKKWINIDNYNNLNIGTKTIENIKDYIKDNKEYLIKLINVIKPN